MKLFPPVFTDGEFINKLYTIAINRPPTESEFNVALEFMKTAGSTREQLVLNLINGLNEPRDIREFGGQVDRYLNPPPIATEQTVVVQNNSNSYDQLGRISRVADQSTQVKEKMCI